MARKQEKGGYVVYEGEALPEIAQDLGVPLKVLCDANSTLKERFNLLAPGEDIVKPPAAKKKEASGKTGAQTKGEVQVAQRVLRLCLRDSAGKPLANMKCSFRFDLKEAKDEPKTTDGDGRLVLPLPPEPRSAGTGRALTAHLTVGKPPAEHVFELRIRFLRPLEDVSAGTKQRAAEQRLRNLGYAVFDPDPDLDAATRVALACFQADRGLDVTGSIDDKTLKELEEAHGC